MSIDIYKNSSFVDVPYGLKLQQTLLTSGSVTIPAGINRVWAVVVGGGGGGTSSLLLTNCGGGAGGYSQGWTYVSNTVIVGAGGAGGNNPNAGVGAGIPGSGFGST